MSNDINLTDGAVTEVLNNKVDIDFQNIPSNSVSFARCSTEVTNCITEIPQRIKTELKNGVLTLKAGSEVIVPNGFEEDGTTPKFDYITIAEDISIQSATSEGNANVVRWFTVNPSDMTIQGQSVTASNTVGNSYMDVGYHCLTYRTDLNKVIYYYQDNSVKFDGYSLPIGIAISDDTLHIGNFVTFNGFGYMGASIWVDKDVKGLIPNGRNEDGTLKNIEIITNKLSLFTFPSDINYYDLNLQLMQDGVGFSFNLIIQDTKPANPTEGTLWYSPKENRMYKWISSTTSWDEAYDPKAILIGFADHLDKKLTNVRFKQPFRALDYNDKPEISGLGMPSGKHINLTLGASGTIYTAPANGWFMFDKGATAVGQYGVLNSGRIWDGENAVTSTSTVTLHIPVIKGDSVKVSYTVAGTLNHFRFIYTEGEV